MAPGKAAESPEGPMPPQEDSPPEPEGEPQPDDQLRSQPMPPPVEHAVPGPESKGERKVEQVKDMPFDEAINVDESASVKSEDEDAAQQQPAGVQVQAQQKALLPGTRKM